MKRTLLALSVVSVTILAGCGAANMSSSGWVSSGGEVIQERQNPWWVKNTKEVGFCVRVDADNVKLTREQIEKAVDVVVKAWRMRTKEEPAPLFAMKPPEKVGLNFRRGRFEKELGIATQTFRPVECDKADIEFVVGSKALTPKQRERIGPAIGYTIASAIRTSYDPKTLKGKGFVFFAAGTGPDVPKKISDIKWDPMNKGIVFTLLLAHEMGHVFGVPHYGARMAMMSEYFPEMLLEAMGFDGRESDPIPDLDTHNFIHWFQYPKRWAHCGKANVSLEASTKFFGKEFRGEECVDATLAKDGKTIELSVYPWNPGDRDKAERLGVMEQLEMQTSVHAELLVELTPEQTVFDASEKHPDTGGKTTFVVGPARVRAARGPGIFRGVDGKTRPIHLTIDAENYWRVYLTGLVSDALKPLLWMEEPNY